MRQFVIAGLIATGAFGAPAPVDTECRNARPGQECVIRVDTHDRIAPGPTTVQSGTKVHILVYKDPLVPVKFKLSRAAAEPPPSPVSALLGLATTTGIPAALAAIIRPSVVATESAAGKSRQATIMATRPPVNDSDPRRRLQVLAERVAAGTKRLQKLAETYAELNQSAGPDGCTGEHVDLSLCRNSARDTASRIRTAIQEGIPTFDDEAEFLKDIDQRIRVQGLLGNEELMRIRDVVSAAMEAQQLAGDKLKKSQTQLDDLASSLEGAATSAQVVISFPVPADRNTDTTVEVTLPPESNPLVIPVVVKFRGWTWVSMSAGIGLTFFDRDSYSVAKHLDPDLVKTNPNDPSKQTYAAIEKQTLQRQVIPMSFANFQVPCLTQRVRGVDIGLTGSLGVGVNVGTQKAEFAAGPGVRIGRTQLTFGWHWAKTATLTNGFTEGMKVDPALVPPVNEQYRRGFGLSITYRVN